MTRVLVIGDIITDILAVHDGPIAVGSDTPTTISVSGGGSAANTAAWLAALGVPASLVGVVGGDPAGTARVAELESSGVDCSYVRRAPTATTGAIIVLSQAAERSFLCDRGANRLLAASDVEAALGPGAAHLHLSGYTLLDASSRPAGLSALAAGVPTTSVDAASAAPLAQVGGAVFLDWIQGVDILFANLDEARAMLCAADSVPPRELAVTLTNIARGVVVKLGRLGAVWASPAGTVSVPAATPIAMVDPTGAGDAFAAGFLRTWLAGGDPESALEDGAKQGARAVATLGGRPS